jgi:hypothetical protein
MKTTQRTTAALLLIALSSVCKAVGDTPEAPPHASSQGVTLEEAPAPSVDPNRAERAPQCIPAGLAIADIHFSIFMALSSQCPSAEPQPC